MLNKSPFAICDFGVRFLNQNVRGHPLAINDFGIRILEKTLGDTSCDL